MGIDELPREYDDDTEASNDQSALASPIDLQTEKPRPGRSAIHPAIFIVIWILLSSGVIIYNKWILDRFRFPITLTTCHLAFSTLATQVLAKTTTLLDGRKRVKMTRRVFFRAVLPIGLCFSLSLVLSNETYLYLSLAFIQMLKAATPVAVLFATWSLGLTQPNVKVLMTVTVIVIGVMISSYGEIRFVLFGFLIQSGGVAFEAMRLALMQYLLSSEECQMDPLVSLYYFAPVCTAFNILFGLIREAPHLHLSDVAHVGFFVLLSNAALAFALNVAQVFVIGKTSSLVLCLCGIPKAIMLVVASMLFWGTPVTLLQLFGFSIATAGLVHYTRLGSQKSNGKPTNTLDDDDWEMTVSKFGLWRLRSTTICRSIAVIVGAILISTMLWIRNPNMMQLGRPLAGGNGPRRAFATLLTGQGDNDDDNDDPYFVGTRVVAYQLLHAAETRSLSDISFLVLVTAKVSASKCDRLARDGATIVPVESVDAPEWARPGNDRWSQAYTKLRLFELVEFEKIVYLDSDMLLTRPLDGIMDDVTTNPTRTLTMANQTKPEEADLPSSYLFAGSPETYSTDHSYPPDDRGYLNGGFFVVGPSLALFDYYISLLSNPGTFDASFAEQNLLNYAHRREGNMPWTRLSPEWNINFATMKDLERGVASLHDKFWTPLDAELGNLWFKIRWEMEGFYQALEEGGAAAGDGAGEVEGGDPGLSFIAGELGPEGDSPASPPILPPAPPSP
ncbi:MAG: hypothetical protein M1838_002385 [Thelocarpon superellum]|nr:MAG: hypothetical protein M1838_002385 [Thelocarpon superellum]